MDINKKLEKKLEIEILLSKERNILKLISEASAFRGAKNNANKKQDELLIKFEKTLKVIENKSNSKAINNIIKSYVGKKGKYEKASSIITKFIEKPKELMVAPRTAKKAITLLKSQEVLKDFESSKKVALSESNLFKRTLKNVSNELHEVFLKTESNTLRDDYLKYSSAKGADRYKTNLVQDYLKNLKEIKQFEKENETMFREATAKLKQPERASQEHPIITRIKTKKFGDKSQAKNQVQSR